jgi:hypothetical protein
MSGNATYRDLAAWSDDNFRFADHPGVGRLARCKPPEWSKESLCFGGPGFAAWIRGLHRTRTTAWLRTRLASPPQLTEAVHHAEFGENAVEIIDEESSVRRHDERKNFEHTGRILWYQFLNEFLIPAPPATKRLSLRSALSNPSVNHA